MATMLTSWQIIDYLFIYLPHTSVLKTTEKMGQWIDIYTLSDMKAIISAEVI